MATFAEAERLLSLEPEYKASPRRIPDRVRDLEGLLAAPCPRAIREWYEREDATDLLARYSNSDWPLAPARMQRVDEYVVFMNENQGVCRWAFRLDGTDDPEVFVQEEREAWHSCVCTFTGFVAAQVFDWGNGWAEDARVLHGDLPATTTLAWLAERFRPGPVARQRALTTHRFFDAINRISILENTWWVAGKTFADLDRLLEMLDPFYDEEL